MNRITAHPQILGGKLIIAGTRISVEFILKLLASGVSEEEILLDYPHLQPADLRACLLYAALSLKEEASAKANREDFEKVLKAVPAVEPADEDKII